MLITFFILPIHLYNSTGSSFWSRLRLFSNSNLPSIISHRSNMRSLYIVLALSATLGCSAPVIDDNCAMQWVMVNPDGSPVDASPTSSSADAASTAPLSTPNGTVAAAAPIGASPSAPGPGFTAASCAAGPLSPVGPASFPINGDNYCAPTPTDPVPEGAAIYTPPDGINFDTLLFRTWAKQQQANNLPSQFLKIAPGLYTYNLGPVHPAGADTNTFPGTNIVIEFFEGDWTLDLRGVTFVIQITPENQDRRPGQMIYINQSEGFTILGGTFWIDQGEQWTYARMSAFDGQTVTFQVPEGYNRTAWPSAGNAIWCFNDSDPSHTSRPDCGQYHSVTWDFSLLESDGILSTPAPGSTTLDTHFIIGNNFGGGISTVIGTENNGNFTVKGLTSNGEFAQYGLTGTKTPATLIDCWIVQPPPRPGYAPEIQGPAGTLGDYSGINFHPAGTPDFTFVNSWWQTSTNPNDLQPMSQPNYRENVFK